ncbi:MAG: hypothetical protein CMI80_01885 [Candidatus Pelagibacter sp.]|nr:hypothetical protein [Candidatus Pelagibacter sp.]
MNINSFYKIYYKHRIIKANFFLKLYLFAILPFRYLLNIPFIPPKVNLDSHSLKNQNLFQKNLNFLFEYFNSDKGDYFLDQYIQPIKKNKIKIQAHGYSEIYEKYFFKKKENNLNILELGSFYGNAAASFYYYFKNSTIYSGDIYPDLYRYSSTRINNFYIDTSDEISIKENILNNNLDFDIIIEDASHSLKDQIISLFLLFKKISPKGLFVCEELDFPETRRDMNLNNEFPDLKQILLNIKQKRDFNSKYIEQKDKEYFLENLNNIEIYKGKTNEVAIIEKK